MEINIEDYLTKEEIKEIVIEELKDKCKKMFSDERDITRIISNISYKIIFKEIDCIVPNFEQIIIEKVKNKCQEISKYDVIKSKRDRYEDENSMAQDIIEQTIMNNRESIESKTIEILNNLNENDIAYEIKDIIEEKIDNLFTKKEEK